MLPLVAFYPAADIGISRVYEFLGLQKDHLILIDFWIQSHYKLGMCAILTIQSGCFWPKVGRPSRTWDARRAAKGHLEGTGPDPCPANHVSLQGRSQGPGAGHKGAPEDPDSSLGSARTRPILGPQ